MWKALCAPHAPVFLATVLIAEKGQSASIYLFSVLSSLRLNLFSFFPGFSFSSFLSDISLRHLSKIYFPILPLSGTFSLMWWINHLGKQKQLRKLQTTSRCLQQGFWGSLDDHAHAELRGCSSPTCCWLQVHLEALCFPCTHCVWDAKGWDARLKARSASRPIDVWKPQGKTPGSVHWMQNRGWSLWSGLGPFWLSYFGGFRALRADGSCMKRRSHDCILSTRGLSRKPGALPSLCRLHRGLAHRILKADKTEEDALTRPLPTEGSSPLQHWLNTGHYLTIMPSWQHSQENSN